MVVEVPIEREKLEEYVALIVTAVPGEEESSVRGRMVHASRLWRFTDAAPLWITRDPRGVIDRLLIDEAALCLTWRGLEVVERPDGRPSEHRDQLLSALAESGVPLSAKIGVDSKKHTVRDLLRTSIREFHLDQKELEWTAISYAHYLPPQTQWQNRFGELYTFDELIGELIARPLNAGSCQGLHLLTCLTTILLCDESMRFLSPDAHEKIVRHLVTISKRVFG